MLINNNKKLVVIIFMFAFCIQTKGADLEVRVISATMHETIELRERTAVAGGTFAVANLPEDVGFLLIDLSIRATNWSDGESSIKLDQDSVRVRLADGSYRPAMGIMEKPGQLQIGHFSERLRKNRSSDVTNGRYLVIFFVPSDTRAAKITVVEHSLDLSIKPGQSLPGPGEVIDVEIKEVREAEALYRKKKAGEPRVEITQTYRVSHGRMIAVDIEVKPRDGAYLPVDDFHVFTTDFGLLCDGFYVPASGQKFGDSEYVSTATVNSPKDDNGEFMPIKRTYYFRIPENATNFTLTYLLEPVAKWKDLSTHSD